MITWLRQDASLRTRLALGFASVSLVAGAGLVPLIEWRLQLPDTGTVPADQALAAAMEASLDSALVWGGVGLVASLGLGVVWSASLAGPILRALQLLEAEAGPAAPLAAVIDGTNGKGCVGRIARATLRVREIAGAKQRAEQDVTENIAALATARGENAAQAAQYATQQRQILDALAQCLEQLASGDLSARLTAALPPEYDKVRQSFNDVINGLHISLASVAERVGALLAGAEEMSGTAQDMARRTEQQAVTLKQTTSALGEITETVRKSTAGAEEANNVVSTARADAEKSGQVMAQAMTAMNQIEQSASQISQIIGVIDEIAFQTNLLALNAGVEAARAGEAGRGFAVVASEVRGLAQRSAEAAKEIKTLITTSSQQVKSGVSLVAQAGDGLHRIVNQVGSLNELIAGLTDSAKAQVRGLSEVNAVVSQMDQATQQSAAMVLGSTTSGATLAREAEALAREVGAKLGEDAPRRPAASRSTSAAKSDRPTIRSLLGPGPSPATRSTPARPATARAATARAATARAATTRVAPAPAAAMPGSRAKAAPIQLGGAHQAAREAVRQTAVRETAMSERGAATARQTKPATDPDDWSEF